MKILVIDTVSNFCITAIFDVDKGCILGMVREDIGRGHAEVLMNYIERIVHESKVAFSSINRIAVNIGPGSFTGIRIGVSAARGFALALGCLAVGVTAFEALAHDAMAHYPNRSVLVAIKAHRDEIYVQLFNQDGDPQSEPFVGHLQDVLVFFHNCDTKPILTGSAACIVHAALKNEPLMTIGEVATNPIAAIARIAAKNKLRQAPKPLYLREPDAKPQSHFTLLRKTML